MGVGSNRPLLYEEVVAELYKLIDREQIMPGNKFPCERELVQQWDISRNVLREAFHVLEDRGIIISRQGKGRFLRVLPDWENTRKNENLSKNLERYSLLEVYETRQVLEVKVIEQVTQNVSDGDIEEICGLYQTLVEKFRASDSTVGEMDMHRIYGQKCKNNFLFQMVDITLRTTRDMMYNRFRDTWGAYTEETIVEHGEIVNAIRDRDAARAKEAMHRHIQHTIDRLR